MRFGLTYLIALIIAGLLNGCSSPQTAQKSSKRIITIGNTLTEIICALGLQTDLIATDVTSTFPEKVLQLPKVGHLRSLQAEPLIGLKPTELLIHGELPPQLLDQLKGAGIKTQVFPQESTVKGTFDLITRLGKAFNRPAQADSLIKQIEKDLKELSDKQVKVSASEKPKVLFIYARGQGNLYVAGTQTPMETMISLAGGVNSIQSFEGFKPLTAEAVTAANPDIIVMTANGVKGLGGRESALQTLPGVAGTKAAQKHALIIMDDAYLLGFGPRLGKASKDLHHQIQKYSISNQP